MSIVKQPNGIYTWSCRIDPAYYRNSIRPGFYACIGIAVFLLALGGVFSWQQNDLQSFLIIAACAGVFMLISLVVFGFAFSAADPRESYELTDTFVKIGNGKSSQYYDFGKIREISFNREYIELRGRTRRTRVYTATEEDMDFVKCHIMNRLTGDTQIRYE